MIKTDEYGGMTMTVGELRECLAKYPPDAGVELAWESTGHDLHPEWIEMYNGKLTLDAEEGWNITSKGK